MQRIQWHQMQSDEEALAYLQGLPRYKNNSIKSIFWRTMFFCHILYCRVSKLNKPLHVVLVTK